MEGKTRLICYKIMKIGLKSTLVITAYLADLKSVFNDSVRWARRKAIPIIKSLLATFHSNY